MSSSEPDRRGQEASWLAEPSMHAVAADRRIAAWHRVPRMPNLTALSRLWARYVVMSAICEARASACSHDGSGNGCYSCALLFGYGFFLPQAALDELAN